MTHRPSNPMQGDDMFRRRSAKRQSSALFKLSADDSEDFWNNLDERHAQHRQHIRWLVGAMAVVAVLGVVIHPGLFYFGAMLLIPLSVELFMLRRTRSRVKIPDYRPMPTTDVELDVDVDTESDAGDSS